MSISFNNFNRPLGSYHNSFLDYTTIVSKAEYEGKHDKNSKY